MTEGIRRRGNEPAARSDLGEGRTPTPAISTMTASPLLVLGSTGKTGRRIVSRLETLGQTVRHGSRRAPIPFDWHDRSTWAAALDGVTTVYVSYSPDLSVPGAVDTIEALTRRLRTRTPRQHYSR